MPAASGVLVRKPVKVGLDDGVWSEVTQGVDENTLVVRSAPGTVGPGTRVRAVLR